MKLKHEHRIRSIEDSDKEWVQEVLTKSWGSTRVVSRGVVHQADCLPGFVAEVNGQREGLLTYNMQDNMLEIVTLNALRSRVAIGRVLVNEAVDKASSQGFSRVWVITTNDNTPALKFYEAMGFKVVTIHKDSIRESRKLKPEIPDFGVDGIPITDEIELEKILG